MNYQSWLAKWLETYVSPVVKGKTLETYRGVVKNHLVPALGELELAELTPARLQAFVAQQAKSGNRRTGEGLSCASVNLIITVLQNSLKCAREADMVGGYAAEKLRRPRSAALRHLARRRAPLRALLSALLCPPARAALAAAQGLSRAAAHLRHTRGGVRHGRQGAGGNIGARLARLYLRAVCAPARLL